MFISRKSPAGARRRSCSRLLTKDKGLRMAVNFGKLPEPLRQHNP